ncbi:MAG: hypothetical protein KatS3mg068_0652 [Candidatus Sericytochromatia bacterium]|nr:MAG: hypothetical protein KatS3mg068_0652 [Candidatus Sericytochromatia bacterium]
MSILDNFLKIYMKKIIFYIILVLLNSCYVKFPNNIANNTNINKNQVNFQKEFRKILTGIRSNINDYQTHVVNSKEEFEKLLNLHDNNKFNNIFIPKIDFSIKTVLGIFLGDRPTTGYSIEIEKIVEDNDKVKIYLKETEPQKGDNIKIEISQPFLIIETTKINKKIEFLNIKNQVNKNINYSIIDSGNNSNIKFFKTKVDKTEDEFLNTFTDHISDTMNNTNFQKIDFDKNIIISIFLGKRKTNGYTINVEKIIKTNSQIIVKANEIFIKNSDFQEKETSPYIFIQIEKTNLPINFDITFIYSEESLNQNTEEYKKTELFSNMLLYGNDSNYTDNKNFLIKNNQDFKDIWNKHIGNNFISSPFIDFSKNDLVAIFLGKKEKTGYSIKLFKVIETEKDLRIVVQVILDDKKITTNTISNPYAFFLIPKTNKNALFVLKNEY